MSARNFHTLRERLREVGLLEPILAICQKHHVTFENAFGTRHLKSHVAARHEAWHHIRKKSEWSFPEIGDLFGVDHTTVVGAVKKFAP